MAKQSLQIVFDSLVTLPQRMLYDYLKVGKYNTKCPLLEKDAEVDW